MKLIYIEQPMDIDGKKILLRDCYPIEDDLYPGEIDAILHNDNITCFEIDGRHKFKRVEVEEG